MPIIPALNDHEPDALIKACAEAGALGAMGTIIRLPHALATLFLKWLEAHHYLRKARVLKAIRSLREGKLNNRDFNSRLSGTGRRADLIQKRFAHVCRRHGIASGQEQFRLDTQRFKPPASKRKTGQSAQLSLFV